MSCLWLCSFCIWENIPTAEFGMISAETGTLKENSQIFNEDFYLPLYSTFLYGAGVQTPWQNQKLSHLRTLPTDSGKFQVWGASGGKGAKLWGARRTRSEFSQLQKIFRKLKEEFTKWRSLYLSFFPFSVPPPPPLSASPMSNLIIQEMH